ncbi:hypothetical protein F2Q68_00034780 [Brassica cretica]|uniref:Uncharacterized protein n=1 Tax=Brassica cretica TaxID=69181 RepID=A0A8S9H4A4_BRACR|nr:hypothetical protein F2Q68_00034780 [Brassica cretica]
MDDPAGQNDLTAAMALMKQQMQQMQQTTNAQEAALQAAAELAAQKVEQQGAPIGEAKCSSWRKLHQRTVFQTPHLKGTIPWMISKK